MMRFCISVLLLGVHAGWPSLMGADDAGADRLVIEDFEDAGTWRARSVAGVPQDAWFSAYTYLAASDAEQDHGNYVGELRYKFAGPSARYELALEREKVSRSRAFIRAIEFRAKGNTGSSLRFRLEDSAGKTFMTVPVALEGDAWKTYRLDLSDVTLPGFDDVQFPAVIRKVFFSRTEPGEGSVYMDDLTLIGRASAAQRIAIKPVLQPLAQAPGEPASLAYRLLNASSESLEGTMSLNIADIRGAEAKTYAQRFTLEPWSETRLDFGVGAFPIGAYRVDVTALAGEYQASYLDFLAVFVPNGHRINREPMWFAIQDATTWQGPAENELHLKWMEQLGADLIRIMMVGDWYEPKPGQMACEPLEQWLRQMDSIDMMSYLLYTDEVPHWMQKTYQRRRPPDDYTAFADHAKRVGAYLDGLPSVRYLEFWNEPDLEFFQGKLEEYNKMLAVFYRGFKEGTKKVQVVSGGVTVIHPAEKKGFSEGLIKNTDFYDVAGFHNHGSVYDYADRNVLVERWLAESGHDKKVANTEAGAKSLYDADGALQQAKTLVKKITYAKSRPSSEFYTWYKLQDYWDMDSWADDSFGLVTSDNRPKPSFVAYNELIRRLANTTPAGLAELDPNLEGYRFQRTEDGRLVYVVWPKMGRAGARVWLSAQSDYRMYDIFGAASDIVTGSSAQLVSVSDVPVYLESQQPGDALVPSEDAGRAFQAPERVAGIGQTEVPFTVKNVWGGPIAASVCLRDVQGNELDAAQQRLSADETFTFALNTGPMAPADMDYGTKRLFIEVSTEGASEEKVSIPVVWHQAYPIRRPEEPVAIIDLSKASDVFDLFFDPFRAQWGGPEDLSLRTRVTHDGHNLIFVSEAIDSRHVEAESRDRMWKGDSVQVGVVSPSGETTEFTLGMVGGEAAIWCDIASSEDRKGLWSIPVEIKRSGHKTLYQARIPFEFLGIDFNGEPEILRLAIVLNNNNGDGRTRIMKWNSGIAERKDPDAYGYAELR